LAKILDAVDTCLEKSTEDFFALFTVAVEVKACAALSLKTGIDLIAIAIIDFISDTKVNKCLLKSIHYNKV
jgi:hypothetical protein